MHLFSRLFITASSLTVLMAFAHAEPIPPIRPGLWEMRPDRELDGQAVVKHGDQVRSQKPEAQARVMELLKHKGTTIDNDSTSVAQLCLSNEGLSNGQWHGGDAGCTTTYSQQDDKAWKWHASCRQAQTDGVASFAGPEQYLFQTETTINANGVAHVMKTRATVKWLGADCGTRR